MRVDGHKHAFRAGQGLVELSLVMPLLLLALAVVVNLGHVLYLSISVQTALREGAWLAAQDTYRTDDEIRTRIASSAYGVSLKSAEVTVNQTATIDVDGLPCRAVAIRVEHDHDLLVPLFAFSGSRFRLSYSLSCLTSGVRP
jgi:Flp pilus assembly protein TadG